MVKKNSFAKTHLSGRRARKPEFQWIDDKRFPIYRQRDKPFAGGKNRTAQIFLKTTAYKGSLTIADMKTYKLGGKTYKSPKRMHNSKAFEGCSGIIQQMAVKIGDFEVCRSIIQQMAVKIGVNSVENMKEFHSSLPPKCDVPENMKKFFFDIVTDIKNLAPSNEEPYEERLITLEDIETCINVLKTEGHGFEYNLLVVSNYFQMFELSKMFQGSVIGVQISPYIRISKELLLLERKAQLDNYSLSFLSLYIWSQYLVLKHPENGVGPLALPKCLTEHIFSNNLTQCDGSTSQIVKQLSALAILHLQKSFEAAKILLDFQNDEFSDIMSVYMSYFLEEMFTETWLQKWNDLQDDQSIVNCQKLLIMIESVEGMKKSKTVMASNVVQWFNDNYRNEVFNHVATDKIMQRDGFIINCLTTALGVVKARIDGEETYFTDKQIFDIHTTLVKFLEVIRCKSAHALRRLTKIILYLLCNMYFQTDVALRNDDIPVLEKYFTGDVNDELSVATAILMMAVSKNSNAKSKDDMLKPKEFLRKVRQSLDASQDNFKGIPVEMLDSVVS